MTATPIPSVREKALLAKQLREVLDRVLRSGLREATVYTHRVKKKYEYAILLIPKDICEKLEGLKCDVVDVSEYAVVYRCGHEGMYRVTKHGKICGITFPIKMRGKVFVELKDGFLIVYL